VQTASLPEAVVGKPYSAKLAASEGTAPYTWSISDGDLPGGIDLDSTTGELFGTPTTAGTVELTVRATDAGNPAQHADMPLKVVIHPAPPVVIAPDEPATGGESVTPNTDAPAPSGNTAPPAPPISPSAGAATAPRLTIVRKPVVVHGNRVRFTVRCSGGTCSGEVAGTARRRTIARARFTLAAGTTRTLTLRLNAKGRALVARTRRLPVAVTISQRPADARAQPISTTRVTIRSRRR
jgi:hypothetical protein